MAKGVPVAFVLFKKKMKDESLCALVATKQSGLPYSSCKI